MATDKSINEFDIEDVNEGCNYADDILAVTKKQSPNSMNVEFFNGRIRKRPGDLAFTTPPSGQGGIDNFTKLMLHMDGTNGSTSFVDTENIPKTVTPSGNAQITTSTYEFATGSLQLGGDNNQVTQLLLHGEGVDGGTTFTDSGIHAYPLTPTPGAGSVVTSTSQVKFGSSSIRILQQGGDTHTAYLTAAGMDTTKIANTYDWTIDGWYYITGTGATWTPFFTVLKDDASTYLEMGCTHDETNGILYYIVNGAQVFSYAFLLTGMTQNAWHHVALVRTNNIFKVFVDGVLVFTQSDSTSLATTMNTLILGADGGSIANSDRVYTGYIDEFRLSSTAQWINTFTPAVAPYALIGDYLSIPNSTDWFMDSDFTVDCWVKFISFNANQSSACFCQGVDSTHYWKLVIDSASSVTFLLENGGVGNISLNWTTSLTLATWYHLAIVRTGNNFILFVNGMSQGTNTSSSALINFAAPFIVGSDTNNIQYFNGYIDEFRVSKGVARWTTNFTAPVLPYDVFNATITPIGFSLSDFSDVNAHHKQIAHLGNGVFAYDQITSTHSTLRTGAPLVRSYNSKVGAFFIQSYNDYSAPYYWDGTSSPMAVLSSNAPGFKRTIEFQGYLIGMNISTAKTRCYYQLIGNIIGDPAAYSDFFTLTPAPNDDEITDPFILNGRLYAGTQYGIFRISFVGGVTVFEFKQVVSVVGIVPNTAQVVVTKDFGQVVIFLGTDKRMYLFDGANIKTISDLFYYHNEFTDIALDLIDDNYKENAFSVYDTTRRIYRLFITKRADSTNYYCMNVEVETFAYYPFDNMQFSCGAVCYDALLRPFVICADYMGILHKMFIPNNTDNGTPIVEYYESPVISKINSTVKQGQQLTINVRPSSSGRLLYSEKVDFDRVWRFTSTSSVPLFSRRDKFLGQSFVLGSAVLGSEKNTIYPQMGMANTFNYYQFRLQSDTPTLPQWEIFDMTLDEQALKYGRAEAQR